MKGSIRSRLAMLATLLLLVQGWTLAMPLAHEAAEAAGARTAQQGRAGFEPACPLDCHLPGHEHRGHDAATCASCQAARALSHVAKTSPIVSSASLPFEWAARCLRGHESRRGAPPTDRGPPSASSLTV